MLKVPCGVSGKVRIVKENSVTGEVTHDSEFSNIWTDYGLGEISQYCTNLVSFPNRLHFGSGSQPQPHSAVTALAESIGYKTLNFQGADGVDYDSSLCTVTRTSSITEPSRGVGWVLSELGLNYNKANKEMLTYTLVKNDLGVPTPVQVSAIEILTIYYTVQIQYPMTLPPINVAVVGLPPTTATFKLRPDLRNFANSALGGKPARSVRLQGYTTEEFTGGTQSVESGNACVWGITSLNGTTEFFGGNLSAAHHMWTLDPPITKDDTQVLELEIFWQFTNATPIEIEP